MPRTLLVTGVNGFLGPYIVQEFTARGYRVAGVDRKIDSVRASSLGLSGFLFTDLPSPDVESFMAHVKPDVLIHAAGPSSVGASIENPTKDFNGSVVVFHHVLDAVRRMAPGCKVILLSSAAVYGNPRNLPVDENAAARPVSPYGFHKQICEILMREFNVVYNVQGCATRIFSAYGPGLCRQVLWDICRMALTDHVVALQGTGEETRDFIYAQDVARALAIIVERGDLRGEVYNLGWGIETRIMDLATFLVQALGVNCRIEFARTTRPGDPLFWRADITRLKKLGFVPSIPLTKGAADYAGWAMKSLRPQHHNGS